MLRRYQLASIETFISYPNMIRISLENNAKRKNNMKIIIKQNNPLFRQFYMLAYLLPAYAIPYKLLKA